MAIGSVKGLGGSSNNASVAPVSVNTDAVQAHDDATATANSAGELLRPFSAVQANLHWVRRGERATRVQVAARMAAASTLTTSPVVRVIGAFPLSTATIYTPESNSTANTLPDDGTWVAMRLDNTDANAAGKTLTLASSASGILRDTTYAWSDWGETLGLDSAAGIDLFGCWYFAVFIETAAVVSAGAVPVFCRSFN